MAPPDLFKLLKKNWQQRGSSANVTLSTLTIGPGQDSMTGWWDRNYATSTITMFIIPKAANQTVLRTGLLVLHEAVGITKDTVREGDKITDAAGNVYLVAAVRDHTILDEFMFNEVQLQLLPRATVTGVWTKWTGEASPFFKIRRAIERNTGQSSVVKLFTLSLGAADAVTGWYLPTYAAPVNINCPILDLQASITAERIGLFAAYEHIAYTQDDVNEGDIIEDAFYSLHRVRTVKAHSIGDHLLYFELGLEFIGDVTTGPIITGPPGMYFPFFALLLTSYLSDVDKDKGTITLDTGAPATLPIGVYVTEGPHTALYVPASGYRFASWFGSSITITDASVNPCAFTRASGVTGLLKAIYRTPYERIINGGFELSSGPPFWNSTGWTAGAVSDPAQHHSGAYSCFMYETITKQAVDLNIPVADIASFGLWAMAAGYTDAICTILYTDATDSGAIPLPSGGAFAYVDLMPYLAAGKNVKNIELEGGSGFPTWIDDVSLIA